MSGYKHTERGTIILFALAIPLLICLSLGFSGSRVALYLAPIFAIAASLFYSLTIEISQEQLIWWFGSGIIRKHVLLKDIASARIVRTNFLEGWGIHLSRFGRLYNISSLNAVAITLDNGKRFALGTNQPQELLEALQRMTNEARLNPGS